MSDTITLEAQPTQRTVAELQARLNGYEAELPDLEEKYALFALDYEDNTPESNEILKQITVKIDQTHDRIRALRAAIKAATDRAERETAGKRYAVQKTQLGNVARLMERREKAAAGLQDAIKSAVTHYHSLLDLSARAAVAWPGGPKQEYALQPGALIHLIEADLWRQGGAEFKGAGLDTGHPSFPGGRNPELRTNDRNTIKPLIEQIAAINDYAITKATASVEALNPNKAKGDV